MAESLWLALKGGVPQFTVYGTSAEDALARGKHHEIDAVVPTAWAQAPSLASGHYGDAGATFNATARALEIRGVRYYLDDPGRPGPGGRALPPDPEVVDEAAIAKHVESEHEAALAQHEEKCLRQFRTANRRDPTETEMAIFKAAAGPPEPRTITLIERGTLKPVVVARTKVDGVYAAAVIQRPSAKA